MITTKHAEDADIKISYSGGFFRVSGKICGHQDVELKLESAMGVKMYIGGLQNIHDKETGLALRVFDMSERVYHI